MNDVDKVNHLLRNGFINELRQETGVSRNFVANCLRIQADRVKAWETGLFTTVSSGTATKVLRLHEDYVAASSALASKRLGWPELISRREAAMILGIGAYALDQRLRNRYYKYIDFDTLGLWLVRTLVDELK